jgi:hypothetical protein
MVRGGVRLVSERDIRELVSDRDIRALLVRAERGSEEQQGLLGVGGQQQRAQWHAWRVSMQNEEEKRQGEGKKKGMHVAQNVASIRSGRNVAMMTAHVRTG